MDELLTSLRIISMIREGQKARIRDGLIFLEYHSSGVAVGIRRWINRDNRVTTIRYIKNVINQGLATHEKEPNDTLKKGLEGAIRGIDNLCVTYGDDATTLASLTVLKDKIIFK